MVLALQHFALGIPDLKVGDEFYTTFGLEKREGQADTLAFRSEGRAHDEVILRETGQDRKLHHISFGSDPAGLARLKERLEANGNALLDPPYDGAPDGLWFRDPDHNLVNVHEASPAVLADEVHTPVNRLGKYDRVGQRGTPERATMRSKPRRLGHMIVFTTDPTALAKFYVDVVGMQLSDTIEGGFGAFLRTAGSSDHHVLGMLKSDRAGFHHASFEMGSLDEFAIGAQRIAEKGYKHAWGPGRHGVGSNYFHYFRDPWNGMAEYFCDIDYIAEETEWKIRDWTKKDGMFLWSADGPPPKDFGQNYEG